MKIDLHTHSIASHDGSLKTEDYRRMLDAGQLDCIAVTDHNVISFAKQLNEELGHQIIIGEEISTLDGEIIGLYLQEAIRPGLSAAATVQAIKKQGGLVYIPHPFETVRKGIKKATLDSISKDVDIIETQNGRAIFQNKSEQAIAWATEHKIPGIASSDSHGWHGWGRTYSIVSAIPTRATLVDLLSQAQTRFGSPGIRGVLYPKFNRFFRRKK
jgi:predicted metal-dependent phosphoesterase TrpH